jgi:hypothetical protein
MDMSQCCTVFIKAFPSSASLGSCLFMNIPDTERGVEQQAE